MFRSARVKLTAWYLLIIMTVSLSFSATIYQGVSLEFQRRLEMIEGRLRGEGFQLRLPPPRQAILFVEDLEASQEKLFWLLVWANGIILVVSATAGWFLAGRTLAPIEGAMEEQKRFVADASHELRTPLTALKTSLEVGLRDKKLSLKDARSLLESNLEEVDSLRSLANNLLSLTRYQTNGHRFGRQKLEVDTWLEGIRRQIEPLAKAKKINFFIKNRARSIWGNQESLTELIVILLDNAVKYTPQKGRVGLDINVENKQLVIRVKDTGMGISREDLPHIFDRFYRADQSRTKNQVPGFGLGLALAKKIVGLHHGTMKVESRVGKGSTFTIRLPQSHTYPL